ncbi:MAG: hypothetical protein RR501_12385, partial [Cloacibacillus sp.]
ENFAPALALFCKKLHNMSSYKTYQMLVRLVLYLDTSVNVKGRRRVEKLFPFLIHKPHRLTKI